MNKYYVLIIDTLVTAMPISFLGLLGIMWLKNL